MRDRILCRAGRLGLALAVAAGIAAPAPADTEVERNDTRARMREIFGSIRILLPLSVNDARFRDPQNRELIRKSLAALEGNAEILAAHARQDDTARRFLGDSLARDASEALQRFEQGRYDSAEFLIQQTTENCVACHTKLPSPGDSPLAQDFVDRSALAALPLAERARLQVATRQFDDALASYELLFQDPTVHPAEMLGPLTDYLLVSVRVKNDYDRPVPVLEKFSRRPDLWRHLRFDVEQWIASLRELRPLRDEPPDLARARSTIEASKQLIQFPADRRALVHYVVASSLLHRYLDTQPASPEDVAEAYYLLGLTESRIGDTYWVTQADVYLETAIRKAPQGPFAERAYVLLEEETILGYTGSSGTHLPPSLEKRLAELRALIDRPASP